ncbi:hydrogen peroxide-inducible genes activator [Tellurirhabdus rosea]|uniref:hydrogen peroxide-inducible genes activator n=1 Tax=Tellurirhabdus rosea TaxID=2674997 RepID=UPI002252E94A|nr:hydrogen peroxide-inducible genes activator [Tellurirhabdus rosea]
MTLTQLDYIVAVDTHRHFATAAESCHVTQPTLSMQIQKLEDELGVLIFDRSKQPVVPTEIGTTILLQAREVLQAARRIPEIVGEMKEEYSGELRIGIIPTLAPYLLPYFIGSFMKRYPSVTVQIQELMTEQVVERLKNGLLDVGMVVTPLQDHGINEVPLFYEPFMVYAAEGNALLRRPHIAAAELPQDGLWLLTEGHCFRNQVVNLCAPSRRSDGQPQLLRYETGSLETLVKLIDRQDGFTLLPYLATLDMNDARRQRLRPFTAPQPVREVSLVTHRSFLKRKLITALKKEILANLPAGLQLEKKEKAVVAI